MTRIGQYEILSKIASGGMGTVYRAIHTALHREVALKVLLPSLADDVSALARFHREAQAASKLRHPNIIEVYDLGQADGQTYMAMEFVPSGSLQQKLRELAIEDKAMSEEEALRIIRPVADALNYAHEQGLIHRDVKPSNILLRADGTPVLADFGIVLATAATRLTSNVSTIGTPEYMSPEQGRGGAVDGRSDLYSLGIVLYEMLAGVTPFKADTPVAIVYKHIKEPLPGLMRNDVSLRTRRIIEKVTAKDPNDRFQTGADMVRAIDVALADLQRSPGAKTRTSMTMPIAATGPQPLTAAAPQANRDRSWRTAIIALIAALVLIVLAGTVVTVLSLSSQPAAAPPVASPTATQAATPIQPTSPADAGAITPTETAAVTVTSPIGAGGIGSSDATATDESAATPDLTATADAAASPTPTEAPPTDTPPTAVPPTVPPPPTLTPLPSGSCLSGYVWRLARPADKVCVTPASRAQAHADNEAAASRRVVATDGPDTCKSGFVWRQVTADDHVCVTPDVRAQVEADNAAAASRKLLQYGPDTCVSGYVWRDAFPDDHVCVTGDVRSQAAADNAAAASRVNPSGPYGPDTCVSGYVWREARSTDHVCVTGDVRTQAAADNAAAASRRLNAPYGPDTCIEGYVWRDARATDHVCVTGDVRAQAAADNAAAASRKLLQNGPDTCIDGYVWRTAFAGDHVCVTPAAYTQVQNDNAEAPSHTVP